VGTGPSKHERALPQLPHRVHPLVSDWREASHAANARGSQLVAMYYQDHPELMQGGVPGAYDVGARTLAVQEDVARLVKPVIERFDRQLARQQTLVERLRFLSPAVVAQEALSDIAGTGALRYRRFVAQVDAYLDELRAFFGARMLRGARVTSAGIAALPVIFFHDEPIAPLVARVVAALAPLILLTMLLTCIGIRRLRRMPLAER
jgi:ABC-2 type transport system permease protein